MKEKIIKFYKEYKLLALIILAISPFYLVHGCPIRFFTGICCPGCGMSRATMALLRFDFATAFEMHPLVFIMPVIAILFLLRKKFSKKGRDIFAIVITVIFLTVFLIRVFTGSEVAYIDPTKGAIFKIVTFLINFIKQFFT